MFDLFIFLNENYTLSILIIAILGLCIGSFLNVVIYRLPKMLIQELEEDYHTFHTYDLPHKTVFNLSYPFSHCPHCNNSILWQDNIPIISWIYLKGRCRNCQCRISIRYPIIEILTSLMSIFIFLKLGWSLSIFAALIFCYFLIALTFIDLDTQLLPDKLTFPLLFLGLAANSFSLFVDPISSIWGSIIGFLSLYLICALYKLFTQKQAMGNGDFKLLAALGAWCGVHAIFSIIFSRHS